MALFPRCNNPVPVVGRHGLTLVGCHSCIQCRVAAQEHLCKILEVEASKHKYVELLCCKSFVGPGLCLGTR